MSIDFGYEEDREQLEQDAKQLRLWLEDVELMLHINKYTDEEAYIDKYIFSHKNLSKEDLDSRLVELRNIFYIIRNN